MTEPGFVVTIKDVYDKVTALSDSFIEVTRAQATELALVKQRVGSLEQDKADRKADRRTIVITKWQSIVALVAATASPVVSYFIMHH